MHRLALALSVLAALAPIQSPAPVRAEDAPKPLRAGIIGLDTSHVTAFTSVLNNPRAKPEVAGVRVVAAYPGGSADVESSHSRVAGYTADLKEKFGVEIVDSIDALLEKVDVVLLESVDGRKHLAQAEPVLKARKPVFIDKPVAGTLADAIKIFQLAEQYGTPCFSSSSLRYSPSIVALLNNPKVGDIVGCDAFGPCSLEEHHPDLFWYGVHGVESLFTVMGTGCVSVARVQTEGTELVTGTWEKGRVGTFRGIRQGKADYGVLAFGTKGVVLGQGYGGYEPLLVEVCRFFRTGKPPVSAKETIELFAFMEAADESKRRGGAPVTLESVLAKARDQAGSSK
ncbi:MAG: Gfo/Idh/MocA family oxidoreductase [Isosphaeraceae bacterium]|nr:Gfo/Idh/MocA family oxidoreductase [Isosphaeraceae bacterium]